MDKQMHIYTLIDRKLNFMTMSALREASVKIQYEEEHGIIVQEEDIYKTFISLKQLEGLLSRSLIVGNFPDSTRCHANIFQMKCVFLAIDSPWHMQLKIKKIYFS